jgi:hypothetical protein
MKLTHIIGKHQRKVNRSADLAHPQFLLPLTGEQEDLIGEGKKRIRAALEDL